MARVELDGVSLQEADTTGTCAGCGRSAEVRPYGEKDALVCVTCSAADRLLTRRWIWNTADVQKPVRVLGQRDGHQQPE